MKKVQKKDLRQFGIVLGIILGVFGSIHFFKSHASAYKWFFSFSAVSFVFGIFFPLKLKPVFTVFTKVAHAIGWVNTKIILTAVYYVILTPIGLLMRVFGKDLLNLKIDKRAASYWTARKETKPSKESLTKQF